jgi:peptidoglycan/xylan/chitin deacetylase (PgdA/CDA1 family)
MVKFFSLHTTVPGALPAILLITITPVFFLSCKQRNDIYPRDESISVKNKLYWDLPKGLISLTYDDGPGPGTLDLAKWLYSQNICATFFVVGNSDEGGGFVNYPILDSLIYYGQRIGNHTFNHRDLTQLSCEDATYQINHDQEFIDAIQRNNICYFTPPWFAWSWPVAECIQRDLDLNQLRGPVGMTYDTHDYLYRQNATADLCANNFFSDSINSMKLDQGDGGIIKMHDFNSYMDKDFALQETKIIVANLKARGYIFISPTIEFSPAKVNLAVTGEFSQNQSWTDQDFKTIRLADVNGDGRADLIGRNARGIQVALSKGIEFAPAKIWSDEFSDGHRWTAGEISSLRWADVNGDHMADLIIRTSQGIRVALSNGNGFSQSTLWTNYFSDESMPEWKASGFNPVFATADVNGDGLADIVVRGSEGIYVSLSASNSFMDPAVWTNDFSDKGSIDWNAKRFSATFQLADVNGDGKADLIVRGPGGLLVSISTGNAFKRALSWSTSFSDANGWGNDESNYGAIRLGDTNGDGLADIIARDRDGIHVLLSNGQSFLQDIIWYHSSFTDRAGYKSPYFATSLQCADINGDHRCDYIMRSTSGIGGAFSP